MAGKYGYVPNEQRQRYANLLLERHKIIEDQHVLLANCQLQMGLKSSNTAKSRAPSRNRHNGASDAGLIESKSPEIQFGSAAIVDEVDSYYDISGVRPKKKKAEKNKKLDTMPRDSNVSPNAMGGMDVQTPVVANEPVTIRDSSFGRNGIELHSGINDSTIISDANNASLLSISDDDLIGILKKRYAMKLPNTLGSSSAILNTPAMIELFIALLGQINGPISEVATLNYRKSNGLKYAVDLKILLSQVVDSWQAALLSSLHSPSQSASSSSLLSMPPGLFPLSFPQSSAVFPPQSNPPYMYNSVSSNAYSSFPPTSAVTYPAPSSVYPGFANPMLSSSSSYSNSYSMLPPLSFQAPSMSYSSSVQSFNQTSVLGSQYSYGASQVNTAFPSSVASAVPAVSDVRVTNSEQQFGAQTNTTPALVSPGASISAAAPSQSASSQQNPGSSAIPSAVSSVELASAVRSASPESQLTNDSISPVSKRIVEKSTESCPVTTLSHPNSKLPTANTTSAFTDVSERKRKALITAEGIESPTKKVTTSKPIVVSDVSATSTSDEKAKIGDKYVKIVASPVVESSSTPSSSNLPIPNANSVSLSKVEMKREEQPPTFELEISNDHWDISSPKKTLERGVSSTAADSFSVQSIDYLDKMDLDSKTRLIKLLKRPDIKFWSVMQELRPLGWSWVSVTLRECPHLEKLEGVNQKRSAFFAPGKEKHMKDLIHKKDYFFFDKDALQFVRNLMGVTVEASVAVVDSSVKTSTPVISSPKKADSKVSASDGVPVIKDVVPSIVSCTPSDIVATPQFLDISAKRNGTHSGSAPNDIPSMTKGSAVTDISSKGKPSDKPLALSKSSSSDFLNISSASVKRGTLTKETSVPKLVVSIDSDEGASEFLDISSRPKKNSSTTVDLTSKQTLPPISDANVVAAPIVVDLSGDSSGRVASSSTKSTPRSRVRTLLTDTGVKFESVFQELIALGWTLHDLDLKDYRNLHLPPGGGKPIRVYFGPYINRYMVNLTYKLDYFYSEEEVLYYLRVSEGIIKEAPPSVSKSEERMARAQNAALAAEKQQRILEADKVRSMLQETELVAAGSSTSSSSSFDEENRKKKTEFPVPVSRPGVSSGGSSSSSGGGLNIAAPIGGSSTPAMSIGDSFSPRSENFAFDTPRSDGNAVALPTIDLTDFEDLEYYLKVADDAKKKRSEVYVRRDPTKNVPVCMRSLFVHYKVLDELPQLTIASLPRHLKVCGEDCPNLHVDELPDMVLRSHIARQVSKASLQSIVRGKLLEKINSNKNLYAD